MAWDEIISAYPGLAYVANAIGMQKDVVVPPELPMTNARVVQQTVDTNPLAYFPRSTIPTDLPTSVPAYRADPTGRFGGKDGLETQPISRMLSGGDRYFKANPDPVTGNTITNSSKAAQELYRMARLNGAAAKYGSPAMTPEEIAAFVLKEGRTDLGFNSLRGSPKDKAYEADLLKQFDIMPSDANFLAAIAAKQRVAKKLGISFAEAWNGTGTSDAGKTGKQYADNWQSHLKAAQHDRNKELMGLIQRGIDDGNKHGFPLMSDREQNTRAQRKKVPYKDGGSTTPEDRTMADKPYRDPKTTKIEDWQWNPLEPVQRKLDIKAVPDYIQKGFGGFMTEQAGRAQRGEMSPRDLLKAYTIAQSSIGRGGLSHATATKTGMRLPATSGEVRPEGAFAEWLGSPEGQDYLNAAESGKIDHKAINALRDKFAPFGKQNDQAEKMAYAALTIPGVAQHLNEALTGSADEYRDFAEQLNGIAGAKSGFIGSLLGRGDLPTLDARQLNLHATKGPVGIGAMMQRGKGTGAREAVDRLSARQAAMNFDIDPSLRPHYQHLAHHAVWDKASGTETTHDDLMRAMRGYAKGGDVDLTTDQMRRELAHYKEGGAKEPTFPLNLPKAPVPSNQEMQAIVDRVARQQMGEHVTQPGETTNLAGRSMRESKRVQQVPYSLIPTKQLRPTPVYNAREGDINIVVPGDQTVSDMLLEHVAGVPINSQQEGGSRYGEGKMHIPKSRRPFWASGVGPAQAFQNKVTKLAQLTGKDPRIIAHHLAMGNDANNFAMHLADANLKAIHGSRVTPENMEAFNRVMQAGDKSTGPFPHFPGVHRPDETYEALLQDPEMRKYFNNRMKTPNITQALGMPNGLDIDYAISHPELRNMEINMTGHSVGRMKPGAELIPGSEHNTYSHDIFGEALGRAPELAPMELSFLDATHYIRPRLSAPRHYTKTMQGSAPHQVVDERYLNMMNDYYHRLRKTRGFADGGEVSQDEMLAHVMLHKANGGAVQPDEPDGTSTDKGYYEGGPADNAGTDPLQYRAEGGSVNLSDIGVKEAPDMRIKEYVPPGQGGMPVGGVDFQPEQPGQQFLPGQQAPQGAPGQPPQGQPPAAGAQPPQAPQGGPQPPQGAPNQLPSNILQLTRPGQLMSSLQATPLPPGMRQMPRMAKGGSTTEEMRKAIQGAAKSAGMKAPVVAARDLTNVQDFHTSLGDQIRQRAADMQDLVESMPFKYDKGHRVFTEDSAKKNRSPYTIMYRKPFGNQPVYDTSGGGMKVRKDPQTGKAMRTPYEPGYRVRHEQDGDSSDFDIPESAIKGRVTMAKGGRVEDIKLTERKL